MPLPAHPWLHHRRLGAVTAALVLLTPATAHAGDAAEFQQWTTLATDVTIGPRDALVGNLIGRTRSDSAKPGAVILRLGWDHDTAGGKTLGLAYTFVDVIRDNAEDQRQHRLTQSVTLPLATIGGGSLSGRLQAEEAWVEGEGDDFGFRLRGRLRYSRAVAATPPLTVEMTEEVIASLNDTRWGQFGGFAANRTSLGLRVGLNKRLDVTPSYIWQISNRPRGPDRQLHVFGLTVAAHL